MLVDLQVKLAGITFEDVVMNSSDTFNKLSVSSVALIKKTDDFFVNVHRIALCVLEHQCKACLS